MKGPARTSTTASALEPTSDLTVVTVIYGDKWRADLHLSLAQRLNKDETARWRFVRNLPPHPSDDWSGQTDAYEVVEGSAVDPAWSEETTVRSRHHARGLEQGLRDIRTRYVLVVDADFFIVRADWYADVIAHMHANELSFFGAPYHPRSPWKLRYFPCAVCLFIDTSRVDLSTLRWEPGVTDVPSAAGSERLWAFVLRTLRSDWRLGVEGSTDTGISVYSRFRDGDLRAECVVPVLGPDEIRTRNRKPGQLLLELLLPDRYCFLPRRPGYFTDRPFVSVGLPDTAALRCEEYWWGSLPFAVHLRGANSDFRTSAEAVSAVLDRHLEVAG